MERQANIQYIIPFESTSLVYLRKTRQKTPSEIEKIEKQIVARPRHVHFNPFFPQAFLYLKFSDWNFISQISGNLFRLFYNIFRS